ncbi:undecaprenyl-diphosphate phosphatase [Saccharolobus caldissimus]|uniref:Undecaprenyl-diphosphatase n=1 Tax=Saccharolobus caldissimus TaxID=1702097 RepID=A0AAQ4CUU9_9CREN|nr:undecaprenyl-diphosphate phosphatase [Saccharolobus caldissimus]BDB99580.1 undecaprenyl-diphosphatase [Saccharolobus caldissimus]
MNLIAVGIVLGVVQGISEWIPVSSKTQVLLVSTLLLGLGFSEAYAFGLFMEIGTITAAVIYFRKELYKVVLALMGKGNYEDVILLKYIIVSTLVTGIIGVTIYLTIINLVRGVVIGIPMAILGLILMLDGILIYVSRKSYKPSRTLRDLSVKDFIIVGIAQGLAALPGVSRSGMTTSVLLLLGVNPEDAFRLSFIELIPAAIGAIGVTLIFSRHEVINTIHLLSIAALIISILVATLVSVLFINVLLKFAESRNILIVVFSLGILALMSGIISSLIGF